MTLELGLYCVFFQQMLKDDIKPLRAYPFVYLAATFFPLINR